MTARSVSRTTSDVILSLTKTVAAAEIATVQLFVVIDGNDTANTATHNWQVALSPVRARFYLVA